VDEWKGFKFKPGPEGWLERNRLQQYIQIPWGKLYTTLPRLQFDPREQRLVTTAMDYQVERARTLAHWRKRTLGLEAGQRYLPPGRPGRGFMFAPPDPGRIGREAPHGDS